MKYPPKLKAGDTVMVVAPSGSMADMEKEKISRAEQFFKQFGLEVVYAKNAFKTSPNGHADAQLRADDIHEAFQSGPVKAVFAASGGYLENQVIPLIDWRLIKNNPKLFCGFSDNTVLANAITAKCGFTTIYGPNFSTLGSLADSDPTAGWLQHILTRKEVFNLAAATQWQEKEYSSPEDVGTVKTHKNSGWWKIHSNGVVEGNLIVGHLGSLIDLAAAQLLPRFKKTILAIETDFETDATHFEQQLTAILNIPSIKSSIEGLVIGRFQTKSEIDEETLSTIVSRVNFGATVPIIANVDFGHTLPMYALPVGGSAILNTLDDQHAIRIVEH